jgi:hypothetical protein
VDFVSRRALLVLLVVVLTCVLLAPVTPRATKSSRLPCTCLSQQKIRTVELDGKVIKLQIVSAVLHRSTMLLRASRSAIASAAAASVVAPARNTAAAPRRSHQPSLLAWLTLL